MNLNEIYKLEEEIMDIVEGLDYRDYEEMVQAAHILTGVAPTYIDYIFRMNTNTLKQRGIPVC